MGKKVGVVLLSGGAHYLRLNPALKGGGRLQVVTAEFCLRA